MVLYKLLIYACILFFLGMVAEDYGYYTIAAILVIMAGGAFTASAIKVILDL